MRRWHILVLALASGAILRLPHLDVRPMHTDEAVHGMKFGTLLESGQYAYDPDEYHGPSLNYFTLVPAWLLSERRLQDVGEATLRSVPVLFGFLLILLVGLLTDIGKGASAWGALITAISPVMVFYSRYYIQEMLLLFFSFGFLLCAYRLLVTGRHRWSIAAGVCGGLMHASKETSLIVVGAMVSAALVTRLLRRGEANPFHQIRGIHLLTVLASAAVVSVLFFSSFGRHWEGVRDSVFTYGTYFSRAGAEAGHGHPWYYYLQHLGWWKPDGGTLWTEGAVLLAGAYGFVRALRPNRARSARERDLLRFLALYAAVMWVVFSAIPYKTPWSILEAYHGLVLLGGYGVAEFLEVVKPSRWKAVALSLVGAAGFHLLWQSYGNNFLFYDDPANPYLYSHPGRDVTVVATEVERFAMASPGGRETPIQVLVPRSEYWPLPWYLRALTRVGWWDSLGVGFTLTPIILVSPELEEGLLHRLYESSAPGEGVLYVPMFERPLFLRPGSEIRGYVTLDLRERRDHDERR